MATDIKEINEFFRNPETSMPKAVIGLTLGGEGLKGNGLETHAVEWGSLHVDFSPNLSGEIVVGRSTYLIPMMRRQESNQYFVYHPGTGIYVGTCERIADSYKSERDSSQ